MLLMTGVVFYCYREEATLYIFNRIQRGSLHTVPDCSIPPTLGYMHLLEGLHVP